MRRVIILFNLVAVLIPPQSPVTADTSVRRVNIPYFAGDVNWAQSVIFWFGKNEQTLPGKNYADVRLAYTAQALRIRVTVVDYYLWYAENPTGATDLTQYDGVAIYLDTRHDRASAPQTDDYMFFSGTRPWPNDNAIQYHRQARGTGTNWDSTWNASWSDYSAMQWDCNPGPNSNACGIDYGWVSYFTIPWDTIGLSGPPSVETLWGLGVQLYDRDDQPPAGYVASEYWPESFSANSLSTWGELHFGFANYQPPQAIPRGNTMIRAATPTDNTVEDAWMGGGGTCSGGHEGGSEINHGNSTDLFVGSESAPTHFPCFNKSYLRFSLGAIPPGKVIISATMTLHHWGNAGDPNAPKDEDRGHDSYVWVYTISDPWQEMTIHWNNAPLAQENLSVTRITPLTSFPGWPGVPYQWNVTQAVAQAYAASQPVSLAIYDSATERNTSKYLTSSETGLEDGTPNWNIAGRPRLDVLWGDPVGTLKKRASSSDVQFGDPITYTLSVLGCGQALTLTDALPAGVSAPLTHSPGLIYTARRLLWTGNPAAGEPVTLTYVVTTTMSSHAILRNEAILTQTNGLTNTATVFVFVDPLQVYLPLILRQ